MNRLLLTLLICSSISGPLAYDDYLPIRFKENDSVILNCGASSKEGKRWTFNNQVIFSGTYKTDLLHNVWLVESNYSLIVRSVTYQNEGVYNCSRNSMTIVVYNVTVEGMVSNAFLIP